MENIFYREWKVQKQELLEKVFEKVLIIDAKVTYRLNKAPGPGNYKMPSEFGHYASRIRFMQNS